MTTRWLGWLSPVVGLLSLIFTPVTKTLSNYSHAFQAYLTRNFDIKNFPHQKLKSNRNRIDISWISISFSPAADPLVFRLPLAAHILRTLILSRSFDVQLRSYKCTTRNLVSILEKKSHCEKELTDFIVSLRLVKSKQVCERANSDELFMRVDRCRRGNPTRTENCRKFHFWVWKECSRGLEKKNCFRSRLRVVSRLILFGFRVKQTTKSFDSAKQTHVLINIS